MRALVILTATSWAQGISPGQLTSASFSETLEVSGEIIVAIATSLFAYSTLIVWNYYGEKAIEYLLGSGFIFMYRIVFILVMVVGAMMNLELVWNISDLMNGMMALPNLIGLLLLSKVVKQETDRYFTH